MIGAEPTIQLVVLRLIAGVIIAAVQGATIAAVAVMLGDKGPRYDGRLTLMPFPHVDLLGLGAVMASGFGWSKLVEMDPTELRFGRWGLVIATVAGSLALMVLAYLLLLLVVPALTLLPYTAGLTTAAFLRVAAPLCIWVALFTLLPLPPLAGANFLRAASVRLPASFGLVSGWVLIVLSVMGVARLVLSPLYGIIAPLVIGSVAAAG